MIAEALGRRSASATLVWSLAALAGSLLVVFATGSSLELALPVLATVSAVALLAAIHRGNRRPPRISGSVVAAGLGILFGLALWRVAGPIDGDALFHLARVRKLGALEELSLAGVGEFADGGLHPGYAFPLWHGFLALVAELAAVDPALVVQREASVLAPLAFLVVYEAGAVLFRSAWLGGAVLAANTALIALAPGHGGAYVSLALPATSSRQLLVPAVLTLVFAQAREGSAAVLAGIAAGALALTLVHPTYTLFLAVPLGGFLVVRALWSRRDALRLGAAAAALAVPTGAVLVWLLPIVRDTASHNPARDEVARAFEHYEGQLERVGSGDAYRVAPELFTRSGAVAVAALALVPLAGFAGRRRWSAFVLGGTLAVVALLLVPELFMRLSDAVSISQSRRAAGFVPFAFALAGGLAVLARHLWLAVVPLALVAGIVLQREYPGSFEYALGPGGGPRDLMWFTILGGAAALAAAAAVRSRCPSRGREWVAAAAAAAFVLPIAVHGSRNWTPSEARAGGPLTPGLVRALRERVPVGAVVFADLETSYRIGAFAPVYVAANPPGHVADTEQNRPYERRDDVRRFFAKGELAIPRRYGADWLVIDRRRFELRPELEEWYRDERFSLYRLGRS